MATTTNFGWETPDDTDLVKDGAAAIRTALGGVDTSFVDLKGGTTGQVLAKNSNTDLDFTWTEQDDTTLAFNAQTGTTYTLVAGDVGKLVTTSTLAAGQMNIVATDWNGSTYYVRKLTAHKVVLVTSTATAGGFLLANNSVTGWNITAATGTTVTLANTN